MTTPAAGRSLDRSMARAVAWNATARWTSQILSWVSTIIVARRLTPADYGLVGMAGLYLNLALLISQAGIGDTIIALRDLTRRQIAELNTVAILLGLGLVGLSCVVGSRTRSILFDAAISRRNSGFKRNVSDECVSDRTQGSLAERLAIQIACFHRYSSFVFANLYHGSVCFTEVRILEPGRRIHDERSYGFGYDLSLEAPRLCRS